MVPILVGFVGVDGQLLADGGGSQQAVQRARELHAALGGDEVHHLRQDPGGLALQAQRLPAQHDLGVLGRAEVVRAVHELEEGHGEHFAGVRQALLGVTLQGFQEHVLLLSGPALRKNNKKQKSYNLVRNMNKRHYFKSDEAPKEKETAGTP